MLCFFLADEFSHLVFARLFLSNKHIYFLNGKTNQQTRNSIIKYLLMHTLKIVEIWFCWRNLTWYSNIWILFSLFVFFFTHFTINFIDFFNILRQILLNQYYSIVQLDFNLNSIFGWFIIVSLSHEICICSDL